MPTDEQLLAMFKAIGECIDSLDKQSKENRQILAEVCKRLAQLKMSFDKFTQGA